MVHWYKLESIFGPGHQSTEINYKFFNEELSEEYLNDEEQEECDRIAQRYQTWCSTTISPVSRPPQDEIDRMRRRMQNTIEAAKITLKVLDETEATPEAV